MKTFLLLLCLCLPAFGQLEAKKKSAGSLTGVSPTPFSPSNIVGLVYWWVASDLSLNNPVASWVDRGPYSSYALQATSGSRPTNSVLGVRFNGAQYIDITNLVWSPHTNNSYFFVIRPDAASGGVDRFVMAESYNTGSAGLGLLTDNRWFVNSYISTPLAAGVVCDLIGTYLQTTNTFYTNGVLASISTANESPQTMVGIGTRRDSPGDNYYRGYIQEIAIWTNKSLTAPDLANLHYYATNTYGFSP